MQESRVQTDIQPNTEKRSLLRVVSSPGQYPDFQSWESDANIALGDWSPEFTRDCGGRVQDEELCAYYAQILQREQLLQRVDYDLKFAFMMLVSGYEIGRHEFVDENYPYVFKGMNELGLLKPERQSQSQFFIARAMIAGAARRQFGPPPIVEAPPNLVGFIDLYRQITNGG